MVVAAVCSLALMLLVKWNRPNVILMKSAGSFLLDLETIF